MGNALAKLKDLEHRLHDRNLIAAQYAIALAERKDSPTMPLFMRYHLDGTYCGPLVILRNIKRGFYQQDFILALHMKHDTVYYTLPASDETAHGRIAVHIVKMRNDEGYFHKPKCPPEPTDTKILSLGFCISPEITSMIKQEQINYVAQLNSYRLAVKIWDDIQSSITGDMDAAIRVLRARKKYQYENFDLFMPQRVKAKSKISIGDRK